MMRTTGGADASADGVARFASAWKKVPSGFPSLVSIGTGSRASKGTGFDRGRVRRLVFLVDRVWEVLLVVEVAALSAARVGLNPKLLARANHAAIPPTYQRQNVCRVTTIAQHYRKGWLACATCILLPLRL